MQKTILYTQLEEELKAVLKVDATEEYRLMVFLKMAVRDVMREFVDRIGTKTTKSINFTIEEDPETGYDRSRLYLPDDCWSVRQIMVEGIEVAPVDQLDFEKLTRIGTSGSGWIGKIDQREDGRMYVETYPTTNVTNYSVAITYRVASDDVGRIPEVYKNAIIYGTAKHWYTFVHTENPVMKSQMIAEYKKYIAQLRVDIGMEDVSVNRPYETDWERQFTFFAYSNDRDRRYA